MCVNCGADDGQNKHGNTVCEIFYKFLMPHNAKLSHILPLFIHLFPMVKPLIILYNSTVCAWSL